MLSQRSEVTTGAGNRVGFRQFVWLEREVNLRTAVSPSLAFRFRGYNFWKAACSRKHDGRAFLPFGSGSIAHIAGHKEPL